MWFGYRDAVGGLWFGYRDTVVRLQGPETAFGRKSWFGYRDNI